MNRVRGIPSGDVVPRAAARAQLERVVASEAFASAPQLQRFLVYVVEEALSGRAARLKQYTLGVEVFDRGVDFNPRTDPIVRVDARRLRLRLKSYYAGEGAGDPIEIALAKGSYTPIFRRRAMADQPPATSRAAPVRLAVLPFRSCGAGPDSEAFAAGLVDELILVLGRHPEIRVIGQASAARFGKPGGDLREVGRRLRVGLILEGLVRLDGPDLQITVTLSSASGGHQVWTERYEETIRDAQQVFALQDRIARQILELSTSRVREISPARRLPTGDIAAYELYLRGRHQLRRLNPGVLGQAVKSLQAALDRDPSFAHAQAALADAHFARAIYLMTSPVEAMQTSRELARAALRIDSGVAAAHLRLAVLAALLDHDFHLAADGFARALSLDPRVAAEVRRNRSCWLLAPLGRLDEAVTELEELLENDPYSLRLRLDYARILLFQRRYDDAIRQLRMMLDMEPRFAAATYYLAFAYEHSGEVALARAAHEQQVKQFPQAHAASWFEAVCAIWDGKLTSAAAIVLAMEADAANTLAAATMIADLHRRLGNRERAIDWLERAADERVYRVVYLKVDPAYDALRRERRFTALLRRMGLARSRPVMNPPSAA